MLSVKYSCTDTIDHTDLVISVTYSFCEWTYGERALGYTFLSHPDKVLRDFNQARLEPDRYSIFNTIYAVRNSFMKAESSFVDITSKEYRPPLLSKHKHTHTQAPR